MYILLGRPKQISDLSGLERLPIGSLRSQVPIVVIDDEGFLYADVLRTHGYSVQVLKDITDIKAVGAYPIVACDIKGVGKSFDSKYEGAHVLSEIKKHYPNIYLIAYTGQLFDASYNYYFSLCDAIVKKDAESQVWVEKLDLAISTYSDPVAQWKKLRAALISYDVATVRLFELENQYVSSILKKRRPFQKASELVDLPADAKAILLGVAGNLVFKLLGF